MTKTTLAERDGLPDALRVLLADFPRAGWDGHPHFAGLVAFWLDRHLMFRQLLDALRSDAEQVLDAGLDPQTHRVRLSRLGGMLVQQLHGHHQIEDHHYFPVLTRLEPRLARGFDLLDGDHQALDGLLDRFTRRANAALSATDQVGRLRSELQTLERLIGRHLEDEEDLIVPVILKHGPHRLG
ncbi:hemerythrin domain-containing protein [Thalassococcus arenae]|nr:hemerythrin domain-containing protein [Thalassococcus arenae]